MNFASDNISAVHPAIMEALAAANAGAAMPYGYDAWTQEAAEALRALFETQAEIFFVATGTAANALALSAMTPPYGGVLAHEEAHVNTDECGAPELFTGGAKIIPLPGDGGRIAPEQLAARLAGFVHGEHQVKPAALSITNATEYGQVYTPDEVAALSGLAHEAGMGVHMDGARFANAVAHLGCAPADVTWKAGVDALSFGATKNGAMGVEAVIFFNRDLAGDFLYRRKRAGQLLSKGRFPAAQMLAYVKDGLWLEMAGRANAAAEKLAAGLAETPGARLAFQPQANEVFVWLPRGMHEALQAAGAVYYPWRESRDEVMARLVTSFATQEAEVSRFLELAAKAARAA